MTNTNSIKAYASMYHSKENLLIVLPNMQLAYFESDKTIGFTIKINPSQVQYRVPVRKLDLVLDYFYVNQKHQRFAIYKKTHNMYMFIMFDNQGKILLSCPAHTYHWQQCLQSVIRIQRVLNKIHFKKRFLVYRQFIQVFNDSFPQEILNLIGFHFFIK